MFIEDWRTKLDERAEEFGYANFDDFIEDVYYTHGLSIRAIADIIQFPKSTVHYAMRKLISYRPRPVKFSSGFNVRLIPDEEFANFTVKQLEARYQRSAAHIYRERARREKLRELIKIKEKLCSTHQSSV